MSDFKVDAYTATVDDTGTEALEWVCSAVPIREQVLIGRDGAIKRWMYDHAVAIQDGKTVVACVRWGGNGGRVSIELKGSVADETYGQLRSRYRNHACSRMDVAVDRSKPQLFEEAHAQLLAIAAANNPRISSEPKGKGWDQPGVIGRTKYFGTRDSEAHSMLYEKGFERVARAGIDWTETDRNWVRYETSVHPSKGLHKLELARMTPLQVVGWSKWLSAMFTAFTSIDADRVKLPKIARDDERTWMALLHSYGPFLERKSLETSPQAVIDELLSAVQSMRNLKEGRRAA